MHSVQGGTEHVQARGCGGVLQGGACPQGQDGHKVVQVIVGRIPAAQQASWGSVEGMRGRSKNCVSN